MSPLHIVIRMDPVDRIAVDKDTSFQIMVAAQARGHHLYHLGSAAITVDKGQLRFLVSPITAIDRALPQPCHTGPTISLDQNDVDLVLIRTDPPFDDAYVHDTWLLDLLPQHIPVVNHPTGIRSVNEKLWACRFPDLLPPTLVTADRQALLDFMAEHDCVILKPTDGFGGQGVFRCPTGDGNALVAYDCLSGNGQRPVVVQRFVPAAASGDKRILLLDGEILGAVLRVHAPGDHRNNFLAGGAPQACTIDDDDRRIVARLAPHLRALGLLFVGIDVIGGQLIEVNVTSPTCLQEMMRLGATDLDERIVDRLEQLVAERRQPPT